MIQVLNSSILVEYDYIKIGTDSAAFVMAIAR